MSGETLIWLALIYIGGQLPACLLMDWLNRRRERAAIRFALSPTVSALRRAHVDYEAEAVAEAIERLHERRGPRS